jgi:cytochrome b561
MDQEELFRRLAVALAIGLLVGLERGWQTREETDHQRTAGLRTFALILAALHAAAALVHHWIFRDRTLVRMLPRALLQRRS